MKKFLTASQVYTCLLVAIISFYLFVQLFNKTTETAATKLLSPFNHTFSTPFPKSTNWIPSIPSRSHLQVKLLQQKARQQRKKLTNQDTDEKYLTFFTHSGFQNQLIQVENGILLAWYLNRTLILPKAILGEAFGWSNFNKLYLHHTLRDPDNTYCQQFKTKKTRKLANCPLDPKKYTTASFDDLFDLSWAKQHVKIEQRESSDFDWLKYHFGIEYSNKNQSYGSYVDGDILFFKDETRYDWRIYDEPTKYKYLGRYADSLDVHQLQNRTEKLIHFTSLFGSGKFPIRRPENIDFFRSVKDSITYKHPAVLKMTDVVIDALGGAGNYIGAHLRTADGLFIDAIPENIDNIITKLDNNRSALQLATNQNITNLLTHCVSLAKLQQTQLVFLATDATNARKSPKFQKLFARLPCTFTLDEIVSRNNPLWSHMDQYRTLNTGDSMRRFLTPLVDALVASKGNSFTGTKGSTFSGYISRLHQQQQQSV